MPRKKATGDGAEGKPMGAGGAKASAEADAGAEDLPEKFEDALASLEQIVADMEQADLPLDDLLARYELGTRLVKACEAKLAAAEEKVEFLTSKRGRGKASDESEDEYAGQDEACDAAEEDFEPSVKSQKKGRKQDNSDLDSDDVSLF